MIKCFTCSNFRNIKVRDLSFGRINILIGFNNAGKSNFIRALSCAANMLNQGGKDVSWGFLNEAQQNGSSAIPCRGESNCSVGLNGRIAMKYQEWYVRN